MKRTAGEPTITGSKLRRYLRCRRLPFMDAHADPADAVERAYVEQDHDDPERYVVEREAVLPVVASRARRAGIAVRIPDADTATEAARATHAAMREGPRAIDNGLLGADRWWGKPALLVRVERPSELGAWMYETTDERWSKQSAKQVAIVNAFFAEILETVQGARPTTFALHEEAAGGQRVVELSSYRDEMLRGVAALQASLDDRVDHGPDIRKSVCGECRWRRACDRDARSTGALTLLTSARRETEAYLARHDIVTTKDLVRHPRRAEIIQGAPYVRGHAEKTIAQATVFDTRVPTLVGLSALPAPGPVEVFVDFETEGIDNGSDATVFGIVIRRAPDRVKIKIHVARSASDRRRAWRSFLREIKSTPPAAPIFHYGTFDRRVFDRMASAFGGPKAILARFVDVHPELLQRAVIPERSSSLKDVARGLGIARRHGIDGRAAPQLWMQMVRTRDPRIRRKLVEYNEDDLRTLLLVTDWARTGRLPVRSARSRRPGKK